MVTSGGRLKEESSIRTVQSEGNNTKGASAIAAFNACGSGKLPDVIIADFFAIDARLDAIAFILDLRECQVKLSRNPGDIKAPDISTVKKVKGGGNVQRIQPLSLVANPGQILARPPSSPSRATWPVASEAAARRKRRAKME
jgi:hypothetical protein